MFLHAKITNFVYFQLWVKFALLFPLLAELARFVPTLSTHARACLPYVFVFHCLHHFLCLRAALGCFYSIFPRVYMLSLSTQTAEVLVTRTHVCLLLCSCSSSYLLFSLHLVLCLLAALRCLYSVLPRVFVFRFVLLQQRFLNLLVCAGRSLCMILLGRFA